MGSRYRESGYIGDQSFRATSSLPIFPPVALYSFLQKKIFSLVVVVVVVVMVLINPQPKRGKKKRKPDLTLAQGM